MSRYGEIAVGASDFSMDADMMGELRGGTEELKVARGMRYRKVMLPDASNNDSGDGDSREKLNVALISAQFPIMTLSSHMVEAV